MLPLPIAPLLHEILPSGPVAFGALLSLGGIGVGLTALALRVYRARGPVALYLLAAVGAVLVAALFDLSMGDGSFGMDLFGFALGGLLAVAAVAHWRVRDGREGGSPGV
jgi:hypothetical protein